ncbi:MAG: class I SAM-dependent methyltransferase, partial [Planctomycetota bacterium]
MERVLEPEVMDTVEEAEAYAAMEHSGANDAFVDRLLELGATGKVLDIGCGPGHIALQLVTRNPELEVLGVDLSHNMLRIAEEHRAVCGQGDRVSFAIADAKGL